MHLVVEYWGGGGRRERVKGVKGVKAEKGVKRCFVGGGGSTTE